MRIELTTFPISSGLLYQLILINELLMRIELTTFPISSGLLYQLILINELLMRIELPLSYNSLKEV
jgi:hypothetical protein